ncbi:MAG: hypothetical protein IPJ03_08445 [Ignavibacteriales bacterium]|nr:hypothetical protein [Ignavibacteriales bacterium]
MKAKSIKGKSAEDIKSALGQSMTDGFKPTLAVVFLSVSQDRKAICNLLDSNGIAIFGATTSGEFIDEVTEKGTVVILLLDIKKDYFQIFFDEYPEKNYRETTRRIAEEARTKFPKPAFLISGSHLETDAEQLLLDLKMWWAKMLMFTAAWLPMITHSPSNLYLPMERKAARVS